MKSIGDKCELIEEDGKLVCAATDERVDFHFNALLDAVADWRKHSEVDCSLGGRLTNRVHSSMHLYCNRYTDYVTACKK